MKTIVVFYFLMSFFILYINFSQILDNQKKIINSIDNLTELITIVNMNDPVDMANLNGNHYICTKRGLKYSNIIVKGIKY